MALLSRLLLRHQLGVRLHDPRVVALELVNRLLVPSEVLGRLLIRADVARSRALLLRDRITS